MIKSTVTEEYSVTDSSLLYVKIRIYKDHYVACPDPDDMRDEWAGHAELCYIGHHERLHLVSVMGARSPDEVREALLSDSHVVPLIRSKACVCSA